MQHFELNITLRGVEPRDDFLIERINRWVGAKVDIGDHVLDPNQVKLRAELPAEVSDFEDAFSLQFGCIVSMVDENRDEGDYSVSHIHTEPFLQHLRQNERLLDHSLLHIFNLVPRVFAWVWQVAITSAHQPVDQRYLKPRFVFFLLLLLLLSSESVSRLLFFRIFILFFSFAFLLLCSLLLLLLHVDLLLHGSHVTLFVAEMHASVLIRLISYLAVAVHALQLSLPVFGNFNQSLSCAVED